MKHFDPAHKREFLYIRTIGPFIFGCLLIACMASSCRSRKQAEIILDENVSNIKTTGEDVGIVYSDFEWFDGKFNADVNNNGKANSFKGRVRMRRDSLIWIQIKPDVAIIEAFRMRVTKDSIQLVDYIHKEYFTGDFGFISELVQYDVNFSLLQGLFIGNPHFMFPLGSYQVSVSGRDTLLSSSDMKLYTQARKASQGAQFLFQAVWVNEQKKAWRSLVFDPKNRMELDIQYPEYQTVNSVYLPLSGQLTIVGDTVNTRFNFTYTKTVVNTEVDFPFSIPESYKPIEIKK